MHRITRRQFFGNTAAAAGAGLLSTVAGPMAGSAFAQAGPAAVIARRPFGRTGVAVTMVGVGAGSRFYEPVKDDEAGAELVRRAIDGGIGLLETSANYGPAGASEIRIGLAMKTHRAKVFLETKVDARDYDGAMREMERSLKRLQTDKIDLLLHHNISSIAEIDTVLGPQGADKAIRQMVDQKVVRFRGFSCHVPAVTLDGIARLDPVAIQMPINATRSPDFEAEVLPLMKARGIAAIAMKTCGHGYFFASNTTKPDRIDQFGAPKEAFAHPNLPTPNDFLHYALSLPISVAVVGIDSFQTLNGVLGAASNFAPMNGAELASFSERVQVFKTTGYWLGRAAS
jgi:aryl-alcohol dehydrogenase-like predicted oxidoreductase